MPGRLKRTKRVSQHSQVKMRKYSGLKRMKRIAVREIMKKAETKRRLRIFDETVFATDSITSYANIIEGDEKDKRDDSEIHLFRLTMKGFVHNNSVLEPVLCKLMLIQVRPGHAGAILLTIQHSCLSVQRTSLRFHTHLLEDSVRCTIYGFDPDKYQLLGSKQFTLDARTNQDTTLSDMASHGGRNAIRYFSRSLSIKGKKIKYEGSTAADVINPIYVVIMCVQADNDQILGSNVELSATASLFYKDF